MRVAGCQFFFALCTRQPRQTRDGSRTSTWFQTTRNWICQCFGTSTIINVALYVCVLGQCGIAVHTGYSALSLGWIGYQLDALPAAQINLALSSLQGGKMCTDISWEGNRRSDVALTMQHRHSVISTHRLNGLRHLRWAAVCSMANFTLTLSSHVSHWLIFTSAKEFMFSLPCSIKGQGLFQPCRLRPLNGPIRHPQEYC